MTGGPRRDPRAPDSLTAAAGLRADPARRTPTQGVSRSKAHDRLGPLQRSAPACQRRSRTPRQADQRGRRAWHLHPNSFVSTSTSENPILVRRSTLVTSATEQRRLKWHRRRVALDHVHVVSASRLDNEAGQPSDTSKSICGAIPHTTRARGRSNHPCTPPPRNVRRRVRKVLRSNRRLHRCEHGRGTGGIHRGRSR